MFNSKAAIKALFTSSSFMNYYISLIHKAEKLKQINSYDKIIIQAGLKTPNKLKIIFGEATQNLDNFIYGNNSIKVAGNSFLTPATLLNKPCGKGTGFRASELHDYLAKNTITALDLYPVPLPSELYNSSKLKSVLTDVGGLGGEQINYIEQKVNEIVDLARQINVTEIKTISRYSKPHVLVMANEFNTQLRTALLGTRIKLNPQSGNLSNDSGGLDIGKFNLFNT